MARAQIKINTVTGSNPPNGTAIVVGSTVQLDNNNAGGEVSYLWEILDKPEGSLSALSSSTLQNPTFVADSEGTYLIRLTVNRTLATEQVDKVIVGVAQLKTKMRIPAAGETAEGSTLRGWAEDVNRNFRLLDNLKADAGTVVGVATATESEGHVLYASGISTLKAGLPGEENVLELSSAVATDADQLDRILFVFVEKVGGGSSAIAGQLMSVKHSGFIGPITMAGSPTAGDPLYVTDAGKIGLTPGTYVRRVGAIAYTDGTNVYAYFDGGLGHHEGLLYLLDGAELQQKTGSLVINVADAGQSLRVQFAGIDTAIFNSDGTIELVGTDKRILGLDAPLANNDAANKAYVDSALTSMAKSSLVFGNIATPNAATEVVLDPGFGNRTAPAAGGSFPKLRVPFDCTVSKLYVSAQTGADGALDVTVYKNASVTSITCQLAISGTSAADTTHSFTALAGDTLHVHVKGAGSVTTGAVDITATLQLLPR